MGEIKIGCQSYSWQMLGDEWKGTLIDILDAVAYAGYEGFECTLQILDDYYNKPPTKFKEALTQRNLELAALCLGFRFNEPDKIEDKLVAGKRMINYLKHFPAAVLLLSGGKTSSRNEFDEKFTTMCKVYNKIGQIAKEESIIVGVHPSSESPPNTLPMINSVEEYDKLLEQTDPNVVGFIPDTGHVVRAGYDVKELFKKYYDRIVHVHLKDIDVENRWRIMGEGIVNFKWLVDFLKDKKYKGWLILEEESDFAAEKTREAVRLNYQFIKKNFGL